MHTRSFSAQYRFRARFLALLCALSALCSLTLLAGCAQRIRADVNAVAESGYAPHGETYSLGLLPHFKPESDKDPQEYVPALEALLQPALAGMGYVPATSGQPPQVSVRYYWYATGPHPVPRTTYVRDDFGRRRYWRRPVVVYEDVYLRHLVVEAIQTLAPDQPVPLSATVTAATDQFRNTELQKDNAKPAPPRSSYAQVPPVQGNAPSAATPSTAGMEDWEKSLGPRDAARALPPAPYRLLWRVTVMSQGSLPRPERILTELMTAALPFIGKSADMRVTVSDNELVSSQPAP